MILLDLQTIRQALPGIGNGRSTILLMDKGPLGRLRFGNCDLGLITGEHVQEPGSDR